MLNKLKITLIFGIVLQALRAFFPSLDFGAEFEGATKALIESIYVIIPIAIGWFKKESAAEVARLDTA